MFRRKASPPTPDPALPPELAARVARVLAQLDAVATRDAAVAGEAIADVRAAAALLPEIVVRQRELSQSIDALGPAEVAGRIKAVLRRHAASTTAAEQATLDRELIALRRQYELVHRIWDRRDELDGHLRTTVADMEEVVAQLTELALFGSLDQGTAATALDTRLAHLRSELDALRAAREELRAL